MKEEPNKRSDYSVSELAREFGITPRAIRFYEEKGLLTPQRNGTSRIFNAADRVRLVLILRVSALVFLWKKAATLLICINQKLLTLISWKTC